MIAAFKPYPEYKESGLPWLEKVPVHWSVRRIKTVLRETDHQCGDGPERWQGDQPPQIPRPPVSRDW
jgi:type I restriction enzyme S subunit